VNIALPEEQEELLTFPRAGSVRISVVDSGAGVRHVYTHTIIDTILTYTDIYYILYTIHSMSYRFVGAAASGYRQGGSAIQREHAARRGGFGPGSVHQQGAGAAARGADYR
jgi:hypothetical protein